MEKNFNFRDFILEDTPETEENNTSKKKGTSAPAKKPEVVYSVEWADHCDCIISRSTKKTQSWLVLFVSQGQFYIKDKNSNITQLTTDGYVSFFEKLQEPLKVDLNWVKFLVKGKRDNENFVRMLKDELFQKMAKLDLIYSTNSSDWSTYRNTNTSEKYDSLNVELTKFLGKVAKFLSQDTKPSPEIKTYIKDQIFGYGHNYARRKDLSTAQSTILDMFFNFASGTSINKFDGSQRYRENSLKPKDKSLAYYSLGWGYRNDKNYISNSVIQLLLEKFGESGTFNFIQSIYEQLPKDDSFPDEIAETSMYEILKNFDFKCENFIEYLTWQPTVQGYAMKDFIQTWADTLYMQMLVYSEVKEKYPENLAGLHQKLSHQVEILERLLSAEEEAKKSEKIKKRREKLKSFLWKPTNGKYMVIAPSSTIEILDEASNMSNCLASYVSSVAEGSSDIFFIRTQKQPDNALCDVEVKNGKVTQAYLSRNRKPSEEIMDFIREWAKKNNIECTK